jgi:hypothetical protein
MIVQMIPTCSPCRYFCDGICKLKAEADLEDAAKTSPKRKACYFADLLPF